MPILILILLLARIFAITGLLVWGFCRLLGRKTKFWPTTKRTFLAFCICVPIFLFIVMPVLISEMVSRASSRPQDRIQTRTPRQLGVDFQDVSFPSQDQLDIKGWYLPNSGKTAFILGHGLFRSRNEMLERGCGLHRMGYPVLMFDFRSHGASEQGSITLGIKERMDVLGACNYMQHEKGHQELVLYGVSMGAVASLLASVDKTDSVKAIVADSPYDELRNTVGKHVWLYLKLPVFPFSDVFLWNLERKGNFDSTHFKPVEVVGKLTITTVLVIFGAEDQRMDSMVAENLFNATPSERKALHFIEGADHGAAFITDPDKCLLLIHEFVQSLD